MWTIGPSRIEGRGVLVTAPVPRGTCLGLAHFWDGRGWQTTCLGEYHNHAPTPTAANVRVGLVRYLVAARDLRPGDEITVDYRLQPDLEQPRTDWR